MNRRTFLTSMLAACAAPAIVRADSLMRIVARDVAVIPVEYGFTSWPESVFRNEYLEHLVIRPTMMRFAEKIDRDILASLGQSVDCTSEMKVFLKSGIDIGIRSA